MTDSEAGAAQALLALWNDVDPAVEAAYEDWHAREHVPERLTVPGFLWALRYARDGAGALPRYLTLYGLRDARVLESPAYQRLLQQPTPASRAMRPALRRLTRWVCRLELQEGIERFEQLVLRTVPADAAPAGLPPGRPAARLVATRLPGAAALPWLADTQAAAEPIPGARIEALAGAAASAWPQACRYRRRPIG